MAKRILLVDDEPLIIKGLKFSLEQDGYETDAAADGEEALAKFREGSYDLVLLDVMLPKLSGIEVCQAIRETSETPIIMLTAKGEEIDRILGLELGADDYIVKPYSAREVVARVKAVLRRFTAAREQPQKVIRFDDLEINISSYDVLVKGKKIPFTPKEVEIFQLLASHPGRVFEREQILSQVWGYNDFFGDTRAVDTQIKRIRQKLPQEGVNWSIKTVYGIGYKFEAGKA